MDNTKWVLGLLLAAILAVALLAGGFLAGRLTSPQPSDSAAGSYAWPWASGGMMGRGGMMGGWRGGPGGMMGGWRGGAGGMMGGYGWGGVSAEALSVQEATDAAEDYLRSGGYDDLEIAEVMIFDNHAYVEVEDRARGIGAIELLVDPVTKTAFLEYGPSMMWNVEYGMMSGWRGMGGMMRGWAAAPGAFDPESLSLTPEEALQIAEQYLGQAFPDLTADDHAELFPGYYTLHTLEGGEVTGMLSVNGYTGEVWFHTWHGELLQVSESE